MGTKTNNTTAADVVTDIKNKNSDIKKFKRTKTLVTKSYSIKNKKEGESFFIEVRGELKSKEMKKLDGTPDTDDNGKVKILHHVVVVDLVTGETGDMVLPFLVHQVFVDIKDITGQRFELVKGKKKNRTNEWDVYSID